MEQGYSVIPPFFQEPAVCDCGSIPAIIEDKVECIDCGEEWNELSDWDFDIQVALFELNALLLKTSLHWKTRFC